MPKKEAEGEARKTKKEAEAEAKRKTRMKEAEEEAESEEAVGRYHNKEAEAEEEEEDEDDMEEPGEGVEYKKPKKKKKEAEAEEEYEDESEGMHKDEFGGKNPEEEAVAATQAGSTTSPGMGVPSTQNVMHGPRTAPIGRNSVAPSLGGQSPSDVSYTGKSVNPDLMKSPLFVELSNQMGEFQKALMKKLEAVEKSFNDRVSNMQKSLAAIDQFYKQPFYKALNEGLTEDHPSIKGMVEKGKIEFTH